MPVAAGTAEYEVGTAEGTGTGWQAESKKNSTPKIVDWRIFTGSQGRIHM